MLKWNILYVGPIRSQAPDLYTDDNEHVPGSWLATYLNTANTRARSIHFSDLQFQYQKFTLHFPSHILFDLPNSHFSRDFAKTVLFAFHIYDPCYLSSINFTTLITLGNEAPIQYNSQLCTYEVFLWKQYPYIPMI
jgi:hypothetical protein